MKEQLITFETAKLAKEKGFDDRNSSQYIQYDYGENGWKENSYQEYDDLDFNIGIGDKIRISRPTQSLLQKWLREVHNIIVIPTIFDVGFLERNKFCYQAVIYNKTDSDEDKFVTSDEYKTFEQALEKGLYTALKLIK